MPDAVRDLETISPMKYALPSEEDIGMAVKGSHGTSGSHAITLEDLIARFEGMASSKIGVREKVVDVAKRRTRPQKDEEGNEWLVWQH
jgi:3-hydroxyisobutyryl-CoA hydrolase